MRSAFWIAHSMGKRRRLLHIPVVVTVAMLVSNCGTEYQAETWKTSAYKEEPKRLYVIIRPSPSLEEYYQTFASAIPGDFGRCGVIAASILWRTKPALSLESDDPIQREESVQMRAFRPDSVMTISEASHSSTSLTIQINLTSFGATNPAWSGQFIVKGRRDTGAAFAEKIVNQMQQDGILQACPEHGA